LVKILKFFDADPGFGMEKIRIRNPGWKKFGFGIRNGKNSDPGSGTTPPDPQHWIFGFLCLFEWQVLSFMKRYGTVPYRYEYMLTHTGEWY
jgi:hypothetical protein